VAPGYTQVKPVSFIQKKLATDSGTGSTIQDVDRGGDPLTGDFVTSESLFKFSVALPEGNYKVTVILGECIRRVDDNSEV